MATISYPFRTEDLLQISTTLYEPKQIIPSVRNIFSVNRSFTPGLSSFGYDWYKRKGQASITANFPKAGDVRKVGEDMGRTTLIPFHISGMFEVGMGERQAMDAQRTLGKGAYFDLAIKRAEAVRRYIDEQENDAFYKGVSSLNIKGLFNWSDTEGSITATAVAGASVAAKKWSAKTGESILSDLITAKKAASMNGLYNADTLLLSQNSYIELFKPYSTTAPIPIMDRVAGLFPNIQVIRECAKDYNGVDASYDSNAGTEIFIVLENNAEVIEHNVIDDLTILPGVYDEFQTFQQVLTMKVGAPAIRFPDAIKIYRDI